jgi:hypothetical protein
MLLRKSKHELLFVAEADVPAEQIQEALAERGITLEMLSRYYPKPI